MSVDDRVRLIDRGEWKHSWHLKKDRYGNIEWNHVENIAKLKEQIAEARNEAQWLIDYADCAEGYKCLTKPWRFPMSNELKVEVIDNVLTISIGMDALACAFEHSEYNWDSLKEAPRNQITHHEKFIEDVKYELLEEDHDGTTLVHLMFDKAMENAVEQGTEGIDCE